MKDERSTIDIENYHIMKDERRVWWAVIDESPHGFHIDEHIV
jgi:hypothetical protein